MADLSIGGTCHSTAFSSSSNVREAAADARSYFDRGTAWVQAGAYEQALEAWRQALRLDPELAVAYLAIGSVYMTLGCWQEAARSYEQAILTAPHLLEGYYGLGSAYGRLGEYDRAIETYAQAFTLLPTEHDKNSDADVVGFNDLMAEALRRDFAAPPNRLRSDTEGFDFSALLSSPAARRQAARQEQATVAPATAFDAAVTPGEEAHRPANGPRATQDLSTIPSVDPMHRATVATVSSAHSSETSGKTNGTRGSE